MIAMFGNIYYKTRYQLNDCLIRVTQEKGGNNKSMHIHELLVLTMMMIRMEDCGDDDAGNNISVVSKAVSKDDYRVMIKARIEYKLASTCFKSKSGNYPSYISDLLVPYTPSRSLRSSSSSNFSIPRIHLKGFGERAFTFSGPSVWNALPQELKSCST